MIAGFAVCMRFQVDDMGAADIRDSETSIPQWLQAGNNIVSDRINDIPFRIFPYDK